MKAMYIGRWRCQDCMHKRFAGLFAEFMSGVWVCICVLVMMDHGDRHLICAHLC